MRLDEFKQAIKREFGPNLEHATPANIREFLDRLQQQGRTPGLQDRIELSETKVTYEEILRDFFVRVLDYPPEEAVILLWTMAFELSFSALEVHLADRLGSLFGDMEP